MAKKRQKVAAATKPKKAPGREPERLKIEGDWKAAVGRALRKGKPTGAKGSD